MAFPHKLSSLVVTVGGLALFVVLGSVLISHPISLAITGYIYNADRSVNTLASSTGSGRSSGNYSDEGNANLINKDTNDGPASQTVTNFYTDVKDTVDKSKPILTTTPDPTLDDNSTTSGPGITTSPDEVDSLGQKHLETGLRNNSDDSSPSSIGDGDDTPTSRTDETNDNSVNSGKLLFF